LSIEFRSRTRDDRDLWLLKVDNPVEAFNRLLEWNALKYLSGQELEDIFSGKEIFKTFFSMKSRNIPLKL